MKMLRSIGFDSNIASMIEATYDNVEYAVVISGQLVYSEMAYFPI